MRVKKKYSAKIGLSGSRKTTIETIATYADATPKEITDIIRKTLQKTRMRYGTITVDFSKDKSGFGVGREPLA